MKAHIAYDFTDGPHGGGNQFLKALRDAFIRKDCYTNDPIKATTIIFNSHHAPETVCALRQTCSETVFIHRTDGPMSKYSSANDVRDTITYLLNALADGTIFQSHYSMEANKHMGLFIQEPYILIGNAPDSNIFYADPAKKTKDKLRIVATSWSGNPNKGFDVYTWLDENLDFSCYDMTFIGNSPVSFKNIHLVPPLPSIELAEKLRQQDIYITASLHDPCSNALIEAIHCGLVPVARQSGGHPEIVQNKKLLFTQAQELPNVFSFITKNYEELQKKQIKLTIDHIAEQYLAFGQTVHQHKTRISPKVLQTKIRNLELALGKRQKTFWERFLGR